MFSRINAVKDGTTTLESYSYLGLGTVVQQSRPEPGINLTYIKKSTEATGDAGDQYTGLDRFGRIVDQRWTNSAYSTTTDRFQYGYDRDGNALYRDNLLNNSFDELYHANGSSNGYDEDAPAPRRQALRTVLEPPFADAGDAKPLAPGSPRVGTEG